MTVSQKGVALVALPLVLQLAFVLAVALFHRNHETAGRLALHTKLVIAHARAIHSRVSDAHASVRGYVITRDPAFAAPFQSAVRELPGLLDDLDRLVIDNPSQADQAKEIRERAEAVITWQGEVEGLVRRGAGDEAAARVRGGRGETLMNAFHAHVETFLAEEERLDRDRVVALDRSRDGLTALTVTGGVVAVVGTLALVYAFRRGIARRFVALESTARELATGQPVPPPLGGNDEIARLDRAFRQMAGQLGQATDTLRDLYDHAPCGYHSVGPDGVIVSVNRTELRWLGYEADEVVGRMRFADLVSPSSRVAYRRGFDRVREHGSVADVELDLVRKDGTTFPVLVSSTSVRDASGRYLRSRTTLTDLTERKRAEAAVRLFADVAHNIPIGLLIYQLDAADGPPVLRVRSGNRDAARLLGLPLDAAAGRPVMEVFPAIPPDQLSRYAAVAAAGQPDDLGEFRYGDDRVAERWWAVLAFPLPERCVGVAFQDVTARKRAEAEVRRLNADLEARVVARTAELREEKELLRGAFDHSNVAMVITGLDNRFVRANAAFGRLFGYTPTEVVGLGLADVTHPDHLADSLDRRASLLGGAGDSFQMEKRYRHRDGRVLWGLTNVSLIRDPDGGPLMYVGQVQDITERKAAEQALQERTAALEAANRELAHRNAENEMFVYSVSHDLRSPLVNLQGFSKELEKGGRQLAAVLDADGVPADVRARAGEVLGGKMATAIGFIQTAVLRLSGIIDALLRLSRAGRVEYRWGAVDMGQLVAQVVGAVQNTVTEQGAVVRVGELPPAWGDRTAIGQVFANLVGNALTYLDPARPGVIEVGCLSDERSVAPAGHRVYYVRDNGLGIAEGHRQRIFQAFQRAHPGIGSGEGLGLAIVARVAERHRGRVWVESEPGAGSTFFVSLPIPSGAGGGSPSECGGG